MVVKLIYFRVENNISSYLNTLSSIKIIFKRIWSLLFWLAMQQCVTVQNCVDMRSFAFIRVYIAAELIDTDVSKMHSNGPCLYFLSTGKDDVFTLQCIMHLCYIVS